MPQVTTGTRDEVSRAVERFAEQPVFGPNSGEVTK
jgi:hypothetical protein